MNGQTACGRISTTPNTCHPPRMNSLAQLVYVYLKTILQLARDNVPLQRHPSETWTNEIWAVESVIGLNEDLGNPSASPEINCVPLDMRKFICIPWGPHGLIMLLQNNMDASKNFEEQPNLNVYL